MKNSKIEWTHHTFNPWWGCTKVSPACDHCYAESFAKRTGFKIWGQGSERRFFGEKHWAEPLKWEKEATRLGVRQRVFCASMSDVMEDYNGTEHLVRESIAESREWLFDLIEKTPNLDWLLLTKRPQNFSRFLRLPIAPNIWPMTTVESPEYLWRIDTLKTVPGAKILGLSIEPLLAPLPTLGEHLDGISWVIVGGESGGSSRPLHPEWVRGIRDQCINLEIPFHFKQWGDYISWGQATGDQIMRHRDVEVFRDCPIYRVGKKKAGRTLDGRTWDEFPTQETPHAS